MRLLVAATLVLALSLALALPSTEAAEFAAQKEAGSEAQASPVREKATPRKEADKPIEEVAPGPARKPDEALRVKVAGGRLSVDIRDEAFGEVMNAIANAAGFDVDISSDVFNNKLTTRFKDTELQRGLLRLLSLVEQNNYFISYKPDGSIRKLEVFGDLSSETQTFRGTKPAAMRAPSPAPARTITTPVLPRPRRFSPQVLPPKPGKPDEAQEPGRQEIKIYFDSGSSVSGETDAGTSEPDVTSPGTSAPGDSAPSEPETDTGSPEEEVIPEGDIPPESSLLNAPYMPPIGTPATP